MEGMRGGVGDESYALNSSGQLSVFMSVQPLLERFLANSSSFKDAELIYVADFGCSSGPNTFLAVGWMIKVIMSLRSEKGTGFHAYLCDLRTNDFNALFSLAPQLEEIPYSFSAVPGSFFGGLLPRRSIHFGFSNFALHWLSQVPEEIMDESSPAYNSGRVFLDIASKPAIREAAGRQAHKDLCNFLKHRGAELVPGGLLCIIMPGTREDEVLGMDERQVMWQAFGTTWNDLVREGLVHKEMLDKFNLPEVKRQPSDVIRAVEATGCFSIRHLSCEAVPCVDAQSGAQSAADPAMYPRFMIRSWCAIGYNLLRSYLRDAQLTEEFLSRMGSCLELVDSTRFPEILDVLVTVLERNS